MISVGAKVITKIFKIVFNFKRRRGEKMNAQITSGKDNYVHIV